MTQAVDSAGGTITEAYDNLNRVTSETTPQGQISYGYDLAGRRASMTVAGQPQVTYSYDNANRLTQIAQGTSTVGFSYDTANRRSTLILSNGVNMSYTYDNDSRVTGITYKFNATTLGNLTYSYDSLGRRTQVGGSFAQTGLPGSITSATYDAANELTNWNGTTISYDLNGNMLSDGTSSFSWNARNQVATLNSVSLQYDGFGRRTKNLQNASFLFDGANSVEELSGSTVTANIWTGGLDQIFQRTDSNGTAVPLADALGSTIALVDSTGNIKTTYTYDPFGNTTPAGSTSANPSQYTGRENEGNGLYYMRARYYSPALHRFINEDPLGFAGGDINLHAYTGNSPTNFTDRRGKEKGNNSCSDGQVPLQVDLTNGVFVQTGVQVGLYAPSVSYVPSTGKIYLTHGAGWPPDLGANVTAGLTTNPDLTGWGGGASAFDGIGGGVSVSPDGDVAVSAGLGTRGAGAGGGKTFPIASVRPANATVCVNVINSPNAIPIGEGLYTEDASQGWGVQP
jgi:RHS repeat-associated protein